MNEKLDELYGIFKDLLLDSGRVTVEFLTFLDYNKFKYQPASAQWHYCVEGGLLVHSLNVYVELRRLCKLYDIKADDDSLVLIGLLHDLCKYDLYIWSNEQQKYIKNVREYKLGHAEKSLHLINKYIGLRDLETYAIRWHMGAFKVNFDDKEENSAFNESLNEPVVLLTHLADWISARIIEVDFEKNVDKLLEELRE